MIKAYYSLAKPGIIYGNLIPAVAGFLLASKNHVSMLLFGEMLIGLSLIIGSACVVNNFTDQSIDIKMERTKNRPLVKGIIPKQHAILYAIFLGICGFSILIIFTNILSTFLAFIGYFFYVILYGIAKRRSEYGTLVGSIAGAMPPVVGYCAISNRFDAGAFILFLILVFWQMPHFYAIALYRLSDYKSASIPVLPVKKGLLRTKIHSFFYVLAFVVLALSLTLFGYTGKLYFFITLIFGIIWIVYAIKGFYVNTPYWARKMFFLSLIMIIVLCAMIVIDRVK